MQTEQPFSWDSHEKAPIIGIIRGQDVETVRSIAEAYLQAGLSTLEVTMNTPGVSKIISILRSEFDQLNIGAGTVCTLKDLELALDAGSQFIVTPIVNEDVIKRCVSNNVPVFPGAFTPTEIYRAWSSGASAVKVFPATQLGAQYIKDVLAPLNTLKLIPTGGVSKENIKSFFEAGAIGVGMGSSLLDKKLIENGDLEGLADHFRQIKMEISEFIKS